MIKTTELIRTSHSWDGVALPDFPNGKPELTVLRMAFPVGAVTGWHHHTAVNYGIVEQGDLTIVCQDGNERTFHGINYPTFGDRMICTLTIIAKILIPRLTIYCATLRATRTRLLKLNTVRNEN